MIRSLARAHRWDFAISAAVILGVGGWWWRDTGVEMPLTSGVIPAPVLVMWAVVTVALTPLYSTFLDVEATLAREPRARLARVVLGSALALGTYLPASFGQAADGEATGSPWSRLTALIALGIVSVVAVGDYAWMPVLAVGVLALIIDGANPARPVAEGLSRTGVIPMVLVLVAAIAVFVWRGPRSPE